VVVAALGIFSFIFGRCTWLKIGLMLGYKILDEEQ
jgi:hypothetical protein